jgi:hypothetical protein
MVCASKRKGKLGVFNGCVGRRIAAALLQDQLFRVQTESGCSTPPTATAEVAAGQDSPGLALKEGGLTIARVLQA